MDEADLPSAFGTIANVRTARLKISKITARRNFPISILSGKPDFEIVALGSGKTGIPRGMHHHSLWQSQPFENLFGASCERFEFSRRVFRTSEFHQLDFVELMLPEDPSNVLSIGAGLAAEARCVGRELR